MDPQELLTTPQAAAELGCGRNTTRRGHKDGHVPEASMIAGRRVAPRWAWQEWNVNRRPPGPVPGQEVRIVRRIYSIRQPTSEGPEQWTTAVEISRHRSAETARRKVDQENARVARGSAWHTTRYRDWHVCCSDDGGRTWDAAPAEGAE